MGSKHRLISLIDTTTPSSGDSREMASGANLRSTEVTLTMMSSRGWTGWRTLLLVALMAAMAGSSPSPRELASRPKSQKSRGGLRILEWIPSQKLLVKTARFTWNTLWGTMLSELAPQSKDGEYVRPAPQTGGAGETHWPSELPPTSGRYHLYLGNACPWCHRVGIALALRGQLEDVSVTRLDDDPEKATRGGWCFDPSDPDPLCGASDLKGVYDHCAGGKYTGRCTAPLLVDLQTHQIISHESGDIVRMLNTLDFNREAGFGGKTVVDLCPANWKDAIEELNNWIYEKINNGVYRAGFATTQVAYEKAERDVHEGLQRANDILATQRFLCGATVSALPCENGRHTLTRSGRHATLRCRMSAPRHRARIALPRLMCCVFRAHTPLPPLPSVTHSPRA